MAFDDMIADMEASKNVSPIVNELFIKRPKTRHFTLIFISQFYFKVSKDMKLNVTHYFIINISNKKELQQIA